MDSLGSQTPSLNTAKIFDNIKKRLIDLDGTMDKFKSTELEMIKGKIHRLYYNTRSIFFTHSKVSSLTSVPTQGRRSNSCGSYVCFFIQEIISRMKDKSHFLEQIKTHFEQMDRRKTGEEVSEFKQAMWNKLSAHD